MNSTEFLKAKGILPRTIELPSGKDMKLADLLEDFASQYAHQQPVQGYSREQMDEYGKKILKSISDTFLNPENLKKASLNDQVVIQAVGETILNFPLPEIEQPVNDGWVRVDNPPKKEQVVLIANTDDDWICAGEYSPYHQKWYNQFSDDVVIPTHWRPLPEPPKQTPQTVSNMKEDKNTETKTWLEIMREFKPNITEEEANYILWEHTCFPFSDEITISQIKEFFQTPPKK